MSLVFALETAVYDSDAREDEGKDIVLFTPVLSIYHSARYAEEKEYGLDIAEGDLHFFTCDGSPLEARFSKEPYINDKHHSGGKYTLHPGIGKNLHTALTERIENNASPHARIVIKRADSDAVAREYGFDDVHDMVASIEKAFAIFSDDLQKRIQFINA